MSIRQPSALEVQPPLTEGAWRGVQGQDVTMVRALLQRRQNVAPKRLVDPGPDRAEVKLLMDAAAQAPDHGQLTPWHFVLIPWEQRTLLADAFAAALVERDPGTSQAQIETARQKAFRAPCLMLAIAHLDTDASPIPAAERLVSLGCAVQNVLLTATAMGYGCGLTSGRALDSPPMRRLFSLAPQEQAICFVAVGTTAQAKPPRHRPSGTAILRTLGA